MLTDDEILVIKKDHERIGNCSPVNFARTVIAVNEAKRVILNEPTQAAINTGIQAAQKLAYDAITNNKKFVMADAYTIAIKTAYASTLKNGAKLRESSSKTIRGSLIG